jgi:16S rRNA (uracil1498-N3)-methyltransferase
VLRLRPGQHIVVFDGNGEEWELCLQQVGAEQVVGDIHARRAARGEPDTKIVLLQSLLKRDKFEWVLQKATEVGVTTIVPVITERSLVREKGPLKASRRERWQRILTEAAEQSHRGRVPVLEEPVTWDGGLQRASQANRALIACTHVETPPLSACIGDLPRGASVALFVGPEGGFAPDEVERARQAGTLPINLGPRILRTETAAVVAASLLLYECGGFCSRDPNPEP